MDTVSLTTSPSVDTIQIILIEVSPICVGICVYHAKHFFSIYLSKCFLKMCVHQPLCSIDFVLKKLLLGFSALSLNLCPLVLDSLILGKRLYAFTLFMPLVILYISIISPHRLLTFLRLNSMPAQPLPLTESLNTWQHSCKDFLDISSLMAFSL